MILILLGAADDSDYSEVFDFIAKRTVASSTISGE
jgi:hypothetical protein